MLKLSFVWIGTQMEMKIKKKKVKKLVEVT